MAIDELFDVFIEVYSLWTLMDTHLFENPHQDSFVTFEIPVLVDYLLNDSCLENLVCFVNEKVHEVVHIVNYLGILNVFLAVLWQNLLSEHSNEKLNILVLCKLNVLFRELHAHFDLVVHWTEHG